MEPLKEKVLKPKTPLREVVKKARKIPASLRRMRELRREAMSGNPKRIEAQKAKGKLTARERIQYLLDEYFRLGTRNQDPGIGLQLQLPECGPPDDVL